jgi:hypothetical protein
MKLSIPTLEFKYRNSIFLYVGDEKSKVLLGTELRTYSSQPVTLSYWLRQEININYESK